jgi:hypothetical protein
MTCTAQRSASCGIPIRSGKRLLSPIVMLLIVISGCLGASEDAKPPELTPHLMASLVTGAAAANLDASGHFRLQGPSGAGPRQLSRREAEALAAIWPVQFGPWIQPALEKEHGGPITFSDLRVCGKALYAGSPFEPIDLAVAEPTAAPAQRVFGPWWLATLCNVSGVPELSLGISAYATDITIKDGRMVLPVIGGEWFSPEGIPLGAEDDFILSPERAAERVATKTSHKIREVPQLIVPLRRQGFPNHPHWRLLLDTKAAVQTETNKQGRAEDHLYIGRRPTDRSNTLAVAAPSQPEEVTVSYLANVKIGALPGPIEYKQIHVRRVPDLPIAFDSVTVVQGR